MELNALALLVLRIRQVRTFLAKASDAEPKPEAQLPPPVMPFFAGPAECFEPRCGSDVFLIDIVTVIIVVIITTLVFVVVAIVIVVVTVVDVIIRVVVVTFVVCAIHRCYCEAWPMLTEAEYSLPTAKPASKFLLALAFTVTGTRKHALGVHLPIVR